MRRPGRVAGSRSAPRCEPVRRAVLRTVGIGLVTMLITIALGSLLDLSAAEVDLGIDL